MKQPNPLVPQGSFEAHARGKSHVRIAVFTILAIHVVVLGALLIQGCKREDKEGISATPTNENTPPPFTPSPDVVTSAPTSAPPIVNVAPTSLPAVTSPPPVISTPLVSPPPVIEPEGTVKEHTIVKGDNFSALATKYGVSVKAIQNANPGVDPAKLKVGQKVKIPAKAASSTRNGAVTATPSGDSNDAYVVKANDTLGKIATSHGTTVKAIQKLNNMTTTQIKVGQKLKMPQRAASASAASPSPATPGGTGPVTVPPVVPSPAQ